MSMARIDRLVTEFNKANAPTIVATVLGRSKHLARVGLYRPWDETQPGISIPLPTKITSGRAQWERSVGLLLRNAMAELT